MNTTRRASLGSLSTAVVAILGVTLAGCATLIGPVIGPVAAPVSHGIVADTGSVWGNLAIFPFHLIWVPIGPVLGLVNGVRLDYGYVTNGEYGAVVEVQRDDEGTVIRQRRALPFRAIYHPIPYLEYHGWEDVNPSPESFPHGDPEPEE